jgi:hypothetical protein
MSRKNVPSTSILTTIQPSPKLIAIGEAIPIGICLVGVRGNFAILVDGFGWVADRVVMVIVKIGQINLAILCSRVFGFVSPSKTKLWVLKIVGEDFSCRVVR